MKPRILIVDDESAIVDNISYALETEGFETLALVTGGDVIAKLETGKIDLVILDIGLPDVNGFELCKDIRKHFAVPVIFLTARSDEVDRVVGLEIGADDYVVKPFSPRELCARVRAILRRTAPANEVEAPSPPEAFRIDEAKRRIWWFDCAVELSRYEYEILLALIRRPGRVYSRDQLMELVWDAPESSMDRTVDAHIKNIRKKLRQIRPDLDPIVTHRGVGYALKEDP